MKQGATSISAVKSPENGLSSVQTKNGSKPFFSSSIQAKLSVNRPGDSYEQEADAMAETVMRMPAPKNDHPFFKSSFSSIQRKCSGCEDEEKKLRRKEINPDHEHKTEVNGENGLHEASLANQLLHSKSSVIQRACAQCEEEEKKLQRKEKKTDDSVEQVVEPAQETMPLHAHESGLSHSSFIQRKCAHCEEEEKKLRRKEKNGNGVSSSQQLESYVSGLNAKGESLSPEMRNFFEPRFNQDFSNVKVHTGSDAAHSAQSINALAYTKGSDIVFNSNQYSPNTDSGKKLLAHELTHVVQQSGSNNIRRKPGDVGEPITQRTSGERDIDIGAVKLAYYHIMEAHLQQVFIVSGTVGQLYNVAEEKPAPLGTYKIRPIDFPDYFLIQTEHNKFGAWAIAPVEQADGSSNDLDVLMGWKAETEEEKKTLEAVNKELNMKTWFLDETENKDFFSKGAFSFAIIINPPGESKSPQKPDEKEKPILSTNYPPWFRELKKKIEALVAEERRVNKQNPNLPDQIYFYSSDKVQTTKGPDAWTIEVEKGKNEKYLTVLKEQWDAAEDKDAFAVSILQELYKKVKYMGDEAELKKEEQKELSELKERGEPTKGNKFAWAVTLKKQIETLLEEEKRKNKSAKDFPDKLNLATQQDQSGGNIFLKVGVYKEKEGAKPDDIPELSSGTLPISLKETDKAADWVPIVRKAAAALRAGAITYDPYQEIDKDKKDADATVLPAYPAYIRPMNMNPDRTTATIASNNFRMVLDTASVHGSNMLNLTLIHMGMNNVYGWRVYHLPEELKDLKKNPEATPGQLGTAANDYTREHASNLGLPKQEYEADYDWEQEIKMSELGEGDFLVTSRARVYYKEDWNIKREGSTAGIPITVKKAEDMASESALADINYIEELKKKAENEKDPKKKELLLKQISDLETRETEGLLDLTRKDAKETKDLIDYAKALREFVLDDRKRKLDPAGNKDYDPFLFRLKTVDPKLYSLYLLIRQVYDYSYGDIYAIDEYTKLLTDQYSQLQKLDKRIVRMTANEKLRKDQPLYRCVAALVREDDGNLVPLILLLGHHDESRRTDKKFKMMLIDVTFESKKSDMTYVGGEFENEEDAVRSVFVKFGEDNKYGEGKIIYRVANTNYGGNVDSVKTAGEYLAQALAVIGIALLIAGTIISGGALAPATAAALGTVVTVLGISTAVLGAALAARNIHERSEKGTLEMDAEFAIDVVSIIGAFVQVAGTAGRAMTTLSRTMGAVQKLVTVQRLDKLLLIYDAVELGGNAILIGMKVQDDIAAVKALDISDDQKNEMMHQIAMEAIQQGAMMAFASFGKVKDIGEHITAKIEKRYKSFKEKGWVDEHNHLTENAPPFLKKQQPEPGKTPSKMQQGEQAWKESKVFEMAKSPTADNEHNLTVTKKGRIIRCSDFCTDLRMKYNETLEKDPWLNEKMTELETKAKTAADSGNEAEAKNVAKAASAFEAQLKEADGLRKHLFGFSEKEIDDALEGMEAGKVTGGPKSGHKIDDVRIPKRQRRVLDVTDIMTLDELKELAKGGYKKAMERINKVMGRKISDIPELKKHWEAAREHVLKGKQPTDYNKETVNKRLYKDAQKKFWENVRNDPAAVDFLKKQGFEFEGKGGAAVAVLGPQGTQKTERGNVTDQERRISLDHIEEKAQGENWKKALDGENLELMFQNANSWKEIVQVKFGMREPVVQPKLAINQPGDMYEQEADQMADSVMRMPSHKNENIVFKEFNHDAVQTKCAACEENEKEVQRKEKNERIIFNSSQVENYMSNAHSKGLALPSEARNYFEPRFGYDFSKVKIHTDAEANRSAQSINAQAYTSANNIVFNQNQFSPNSDNGKKLLAHELTHVVQQGAYSKDSAAKNSVQRKPQQMDTIRDRLTRSGTDWAVTDENVKDVLKILNPMKDPDFKDTIAAMDSEKLVQELYDEISDDDKADFAVLLRRIQMNRVRTLPDGKKLVDSCLPDRRKMINETLADVKAWAKKCFEAVNGYAFHLGLSSPPDVSVERAMEAHFFHEAKNGKISDETKIKFANQIAENFRKVELQSGSFTQVCLQPYDPLCSALALAYVSPSDSTINYCANFFGEGNTGEWRAVTVFHEFFHAFAGVRDTGYGNERVYQYLMPVDAINNAASYENFAVQIIKPKDQKVPTPNTDVVNDCTPEQANMIRKRIAFGARMVKNALNTIGAPDNASNQKGAETDQFFKTIVRSELSRVIERFKEVNTAFGGGAIEIECETSCDKGEFAYNRALGSFVHICPDYFKLGEDGQVDWMLLYIADRKTGGNIKDQPGSAAFGKHDKDAAYKNLWTYITYARVVSEKDSAWKYVQAEFRYERELQSGFDELVKTSLEQITEEQLIRSDIRTKYVGVLQTALSTDIASKKIESATQSEGIKKNYVSKLNDVMKIAIVLSDEYKKFDWEAFAKWMFADKADQPAINRILDKIKDKVKEELMQELDKQFKSIQAGTKVDFGSSATVMKNISKSYIDKLKLLDGYLPILREVAALDEPVKKYMEKLKAKLPASKRADFEFDFVVNKSIYFDFDRMATQDAVAAAIINDKPYDPKAKPVDPEAMIKQHKARLDEEFKNAKSSK